MRGGGIEGRLTTPGGMIRISGFARDSCKYYVPAEFIPGSCSVDYEMAEFVYFYRCAGE